MRTRSDDQGFHHKEGPRCAGTLFVVKSYFSLGAGAGSVAIPAA
jgi:hypothetical protein